MVKLLQLGKDPDGKQKETEVGTFADETAAEAHVTTLHAALRAAGSKPPWPQHRIVASR